MNIIRAGVIGYPIEHSLSPKLHGYWLEKYNITGSYEKISIAPDGLRDGIYKLRDDGYAGFNVTLPHKEKIIEFMDFIDPVATKIGAVNTVAIDNCGKFHGFNTDAYGFIQNLIDNKTGKEIKNVIILGAGGAARAAIVALIEYGVTKIYIINRTLSKSEKLAKEFKTINCLIQTEKPENFQNIALLVNTTSLGMIKQPELDLNIIDNINQDTIVYDLVYTPLMTKLLLKAHKKNYPVITGLGMLVNQAVPAFKKWFGVDIELDTEIFKLLVNKNDR